MISKEKFVDEEERKNLMALLISKEFDDIFNEIIGSSFINPIIIKIKSFNGALEGYNSRCCISNIPDPFIVDDRYILIESPISNPICAGFVAHMLTKYGYFPMISSDDDTSYVIIY